MKKIFGALAACAALAVASPAFAAVTFDSIDSTNLNATGSDFFGADIDGEAGLFTHAFSFTLSGNSLANAAVLTLQQTGDIDFSAIDLDGFAFTQTGFDPFAEVWELPSTLLSAGPHAINLHGKVMGRSGDGSYSGVLNISAVPEPATWAMMILGLGVAGAAMRRRQRQSVRYSFA